MRYYKIIDNRDFIGVVNSDDLYRVPIKKLIAFSCDELLAQFVLFEGKLYHDNWMITISDLANISSLRDGTVICDHNVSVVEIDEDSYNSLVTIIDSGEQVIIEDITNEPEEPEIILEPEEEITIEKMKEIKIAELSSICQKKIFDGFDVVLSDEETHHFSLSTQDQLNLITLSSMVANNVEQIPYHADGELCKFFSAPDISLVLTEAASFKTYHVSYYNSLKSYVNTLSDIDSISEIFYGFEIPQEYQSEVLKNL